jgi:acyl-coenzyme A synthetase/AMP-(fatty) acid ligase/pimeloyl-ACP methyl ester carboxylesterase
VVTAVRDPATEPPALLDLDPKWSRLVTADDSDGVPRTWHVLDNGAEPVRGTMLCVHGNPTWSYLWRRFLAQAPPGWRVLAVDQLGMGFSERTTEPRRFDQRVADLATLTAALGVTGPVVTVGHDWGGPISLGWALEHRAQLHGVVLANTAVHQPTAAAAPPLIRLARMAALRRTACATTPLFAWTAGALSRPPLSPDVRSALLAPYRTTRNRRAVEEFVADIPLEAGHPSRAALDTVAARLHELTDVPALVLWGPRDPVFTDRYLRDLLGRMPHAAVHRYPNASHLVTEDAPETARHTWQWVDSRPPAAAGREPPAHHADHRPLWAELDRRAGDPTPAVVERGGRGRRVSFGLLQRRVAELAAGLAAAGVRAGDRVALLVPPGADLTATVYACWRVGAVIVVADPGLGARGLARALRGTGPKHVIGVPRGLLLARALGVPGRRIVAGPVAPLTRRLLGVTHGLAELTRAGRGRGIPADPAPDAECAVVFTSGATGPAKGVVYRHHQVRAQLEMLRDAFRLTAADRLVAAFPPFALYGPALGITSVVPDVGAPGRLTATALAQAVDAAAATVVFASPAALHAVVATADTLGPRHRTALGRVRLVVSAGAPVPASLLHELSAVLPTAQLHTPYGMTEALPVTDITLAEIDAAGVGDGVCVGRPLPGVDIRISPLAHDGAAVGPLTSASLVTGEISVRGPHLKDRYDQQWATEHDSSRDAGRHRTGDVGHLDEQGRLWVEGRLGHVIAHASGPVTPVGIEQRVLRLAPVRAAAAVGVGPRGTQQVVVVVTGDRGQRPLASASLAAEVRAAAGIEVAAVLLTDALPVDIRHASKIDRVRVAGWAEQVLAGRRAGPRP